MIKFWIIRNAILIICHFSWFCQRSVHFEFYTCNCFSILIKYYAVVFNLYKCMISFVFLCCISFIIYLVIYKMIWNFTALLNYVIVPRISLVIAIQKIAVRFRCFVWPLAICLCSIKYICPFVAVCYLYRVTNLNCIIWFYIILCMRSVQCKCSRISHMIFSSVSPVLVYFDLYFFGVLYKYWCFRTYKIIIIWVCYSII